MDWEESSDVADDFVSERAEVGRPLRIVNQDLEALILCRRLPTSAPQILTSRGSLSRIPCTNVPYLELSSGNRSDVFYELRRTTTHSAQRTTEDTNNKYADTGTDEIQWRHYWAS